MGKKKAQGETLFSSRPQQAKKPQPSPAAEEPPPSPPGKAWAPVPTPCPPLTAASIVGKSKSVLTKKEEEAAEKERVEGGEPEPLRFIPTEDDDWLFYPTQGPICHAALREDNKPPEGAAEGTAEGQPPQKRKKDPPAARPKEAPLVPAPAPVPSAPLKWGAQGTLAAALASKSEEATSLAATPPEKPKPKTPQFRPGGGLSFVEDPLPRKRQRGEGQAESPPLGPKAPPAPSSPDVTPGSGSESDMSDYEYEESEEDEGPVQWDSFEGLPVTVQRRTIQFMPVDSLLSMGAVSHRWRDLIEVDNHVYRELCDNMLVRTLTAPYYLSYGLVVPGDPEPFTCPETQEPYAIGCHPTYKSAVQALEVYEWAADFKRINTERNKELRARVQGAQMKMDALNKQTKKLKQRIRLEKQIHTVERGGLRLSSRGGAAAQAGERGAEALRKEIASLGLPKGLTRDKLRARYQTQKSELAGLVEAQQRIEARLTQSARDSVDSLAHILGRGVMKYPIDPTMLSSFHTNNWSNLKDCTKAWLEMNNFLLRKRRESLQDQKKPGPKPKARGKGKGKRGR